LLFHFPEETTMMRPIFSSSSLLNTAALLLLCTVILPTHGFVPSSAWLQQLQRVALTGATQAVAVNADYSDWYSPQRVPASPPPTRLPSQQQSISRKVSSSPSSVLQTPLTSVDDFAAFLESAGEHELVLIKFHASWYVLPTTTRVRSFSSSNDDISLSLFLSFLLAGAVPVPNWVANSINWPISTTSMMNRC
jgi:hypothetical protein